MKYSKKILALVLTTAFSLNTVSVVDAAPTRDQIEALRAEIKELTEVLKVEKAKHKYEKQQAERSGNNAAWNLHGDLRAKYAKIDHDDAMTSRVRLSVNHPVGDNMRFVGQINVMNNNEYGLSGNYADGLFKWNKADSTANPYYPDFSSADNNWIAKAYIEMDDVMGGKFVAGRFGHTFGATGFWSDEEAGGGIDGAKLDFNWGGGKDKLTVGYANFSPAQEYPTYVTGGTSAKYPGTGENAVPYYFSKGISDAIFFTGKKNVTKNFDVYGMYLKQLKTANKNSSLMGSELTGIYNPVNDESWDGAKHELVGLGFESRLGDNVKLLGDWMQNRCFDAKQTATYWTLRYKEADYKVPGSFGLNLDYRRIGTPYSRKNNKGVEYYSILCGNKLSSDMTLVQDNVKGFVLGFQYALGHDLMLEGKQSFLTKYTDTGDKAPDYSSIALSAKF